MAAQNSLNAKGCSAAVARQVRPAFRGHGISRCAGSAPECSELFQWQGRSSVLLPTLERIVHLGIGGAGTDLQKLPVGVHLCSLYVIPFANRQDCLVWTNHLHQGNARAVLVTGGICRSMCLTSAGNCRWVFHRRNFCRRHLPTATF